MNTRVLCIWLLAACTALGASPTAGLQPGNADLKSAGALAFGPEGILFVGDAAAAAVYALDTGDRTAGTAQALEIAGINQKIAGLLGTAPDQIMVNLNFPLSEVGK